MRHHLCLILIFLSWFELQSLALAAAPAPPPNTGQTVCYNESGSQTVCTGTGQDADRHAGISWPTPRFTDNSNGTITDNLTGLIWLKNANCTDSSGGVTKNNGSLYWIYALPWCNSLASGICGLQDGSTAGQWRLPSRRELMSLINWQQANNSSWLINQGFQNVQAYHYWSSSSSASSPNSAWYVNFEAYPDFVATLATQWGPAYVLPVRDGN